MEKVQIIWDGGSKKLDLNLLFQIYFFWYTGKIFCFYWDSVSNFFKFSIVVGVVRKPITLKIAFCWKLAPLIINTLLFWNLTLMWKKKMGEKKKKKLFNVLGTRLSTNLDNTLMDPPPKCVDSIPMCDPYSCSTLPHEYWISSRAKIVVSQK